MLDESLKYPTLIEVRTYTSIRPSIKFHQLGDNHVAQIE